MTPVTPVTPTPFLVADAEYCALRVGRNVLGGRGMEAVALGQLASLPAAAVITVRPDGGAMIQRIAAAVIVKVDGGPLGAAPHPLNEGSRIAVGPARLVYTMRDASVAGATEAKGRTSGVRSKVPTEVMAAVPAPHASGRLIELATGCVYPIPDGGLVIGRGDGCDIAIEGTEVSRRHAVVKPDGQGFRVIDESANGTFVNGSRINGAHRLGHGDVLGIGTEEFRLDVHGGLASGGQAVDEEGVQILGALPEPDPLGLAARPAARIGAATLAPPAHITYTPAMSSAAPPLATLEVTRGPLGGKVFRLERPVCALGRGDHNEVRLNDGSVSSSHATLLLKRGTWYVVDLQSANGTYVDGYRVATERALPDGGVLRLGDVTLRFRLMAALRDTPNVTHGGGGIWRKIAKLISG